jgi:hypothetical protein
MAVARAPSAIQMNREYEAAMNTRDLAAIVDWQIDVNVVCSQDNRVSI